MYLTSRWTGCNMILLSSLVLWAATASSVLAEGATRNLSDYAGAGVPFTVSIAIEAPAGTMALALEDSPPPSWTEIDNISDGGVYDPQHHKVKWGPLFSDLSRTVSYELTPPSEMTRYCFKGTASFDGINESIRGDDCVGSSQQGDWDSDGDVDLADFAHFADCLSQSGPGNPPPDEQCVAVFDWNANENVDLADWAEFQVVFSGSG